MKNSLPQKKEIIVFLLFLVLPSFIFAKSINYKSGNFQSIVQKSQSQNKHFFVKFSANWCATCKLMTTNNNNNPTLVNFVEDNFIAVKADVDSSIGKEWRDKYEVCCLPTLIVFSPDGYEIARNQGGIPSSEFLTFLENAISKKASIIAKNFPKPIISKPTIAPTYMAPPRPAIVTTYTPPKPQFVKLNAKGEQPVNQKWTLLIGKYSQLKNANVQIKALKKELSNDAILLTAKSENNKLIYNVTVGGIQNEQEAIVLRKKLLSKNIRSTLLKS